MVEGRKGENPDYPESDVTEYSTKAGEITILVDEDENGPFVDVALEGNSVATVRFWPGKPPMTMIWDGRIET